MKTIIACLFIICPVFAQGSEVMPIQAEGGFWKPLKLSGSTQIWTREELMAMKVNTLSEVLQHQLGLHVIQSGSYGAATSLYSRGLPSKHTVILIDGIPLRDAGAADRKRGLETLSLIDIERIEVAMGPLGSRYGPDASGGVIHIITKKEGPTLRGRLQGQSRDLYQYQAYGLEEWGDFYASLGADVQHADLWSAASAGDEKDAYDSESIYLRFGKNSGLWRWSGFVQKNQADLELDAFDPLQGKLADHLEAKQDTRGLFSGLSAGYDGAHLTAQLAWSQDDRRRSYSGQASGNTSFESLVRQLHLQLSTPLGAMGELGFGGQWSQQMASFDAQKEEQQEWGAYLEWHGQISIFDWAIFGRSDQFGDAKSVATSGGELGLVAPFSNRLYIAASRGVQTPSLYQRYDPNYGQSDLKAETLQRWEIGLQGYQGPIFWGIHHYQNHISDELSFDFAQSRFSNAEDTYDTKGYESRIGISGGLGSASARYERLTAIDPQTKSQRRRLPTHSYGIHLATAKQDGLSAQIDHRAVSQRQDQSQTLKAFHQIDSTLTYETSRGQELFVRGINITAADNTLAGGYQGQERLWQVGWEGRW